LIVNQKKKKAVADAAIILATTQLTRGKRDGTPLRGHPLVGQPSTKKHLDIRIQALNSIGRAALAPDRPRNALVRGKRSSCPWWKEETPK